MTRYAIMRKDWIHDDMLVIPVLFARCMRCYPPSLQRSLIGHEGYLVRSAAAILIEWLAACDFI